MCEFKPGDRVKLKSYPTVQGVIPMTGDYPNKPSVFVQSGFEGTGICNVFVDFGPQDRRVLSSEQIELV
jgi:hypothetical protein